MAIAIALLSFARVAGAQEPLAPPAPLSRTTSVADSATPAVMLAAAQRAQDFGLPAVAADSYRDLRKVPGADDLSRSSFPVMKTYDKLTAAFPNEANGVSVVVALRAVMQEPRARLVATGESWLAALMTAPRRAGVGRWAIRADRGGPTPAG